MNLILPVGGGELWQGGEKDLLSFHPAFDVVVLMAIECQHDLKRPGVIKAGIDDKFPLTPSEKKHIETVAHKVSDAMVKALTQGKLVLSTCYAGWNRSGLVSGLTLVKCGLSPRKAIKTIRDARDGALGNPDFVRIIMESGI